MSQIDHSPPLFCILFYIYKQEVPSLTEWHYCKADIFYHLWRKNCAKARNGLSICPMSSGAYSNTLDWTIQLHVQSWVSRSRTQLQRELSTFGSKNVIWLHSLDKQKSDLTRWTNNRDERQTTDLWVTPTDKGSASLGRNMNALHINKILVALTQNKRCLVLMLCTWTRYPIVHVYCGFQLYTHLEAKISNFPILITIFETQKKWGWPSCLDTIENLFQDVYIGYNPWAQINLL